MKATENTKPIVTGTVEAPRATQTSGDTNTTETEEPRYEHRESSEILAEDTVPREIMVETELTGNTGIPLASLVDPTEDTEIDVSDQIVAEQVEVTHTIDITELVTGIPEPTLETTSRENKKSTTTPPGSPQRKIPEVQNKSRDNTEVNAEQAVKKTQIPQNKQFHCKQNLFSFQASKRIPQHNSHVNKIFFSHIQTEEPIEENSCVIQIISVPR